MSRTGPAAQTDPGDNQRSLQIFSIQITATLLIIGSVLLFFESQRLINDVFEDAERQGVFLFSTMSQQFSDSLYFNDIEQIRKDAEILTAQNQVKKIAVFGEDGRYLFDSGQFKVPKGFIEPSLLNMAMQASGSLNRWQENHLEFVGSVRFDGRFLGGLYFELDVANQLEEVREELLRLGVFGLLVIALASGLSFAVAKTLGATRSLKAAESNFRELIEQSPLPTSVFNADGRLTYFNPAFSRLMELNAATQHILEGDYNLFQDKILHERRLLPRFETGFVQGAVTIPRFNYESEETDDSQPLWLTAVVFPLRKEDDGIQEVVVIYQDVTAEKEAEDERASLNARILQSQKLEGLGVMARGIAHDFNNLLTPIIGNAELMMADLDDSDEDQQISINNIISAAQHAADLCAQMLAYAGGGAQTKAPIDVTDEVQGLRELIGSSVSKRTRFVQALEDDLPLVKVDESQLRQVILNLLVNASEAITHDEGEILLTTGVEEITAEKARSMMPDPDLKPGRYVYLQVEDNGCGMTTETQRNLFNPFFTTKFTGRGLGMSAVLGIVGDHDGGIKVQSEPGEGSRFTVYFPATDAKRAIRPKKEPDVPLAEGGKRVLLVDDEPAVLNLGRQALEMMGFDVITAENGRDALNRFDEQQGKFDCVVLDIIMPILDGEATLREIRKRDTSIPAVIVTGLISGEATERLSTQPDVAILGKPYKMRDLEKVLSNLLQQAA